MIIGALQRFAVVNVDFSDAWMAARADHLGHAMASFDRDFDKFKDIRRFEPKV
jgi:predicted nucleic acid-binding protein